MKVYLAGPIFGCSSDEISKWREYVKEALGEKQCYDPYAENVEFHGKEQENTAAIVTTDKKAISESDILLANCWQPSYGTIMEILCAYSLGLKVLVVFPSDQPLSPWLHYHADAIVPTVDEAIERIKAMM